MDKKNILLSDLKNEEEGVIAGYASVFNIVDQHNDLIESGAFAKLDLSKVKLLWQHKAEEPIGIIEELEEDKNGLFFKARLLLDLPQAKSAYNLIKAKAISGVSIGFKPLSYHYKGDIRVIEDIDLWEISLVTFPANKEANIIEVKQFKEGNIMKNNNTLNTWENFKSVNDEVLKSMELKGNVDPLLNQQLFRMNGFLDEQKSRIDMLETSLFRPFAGAEMSGSHVDNEHKAAFNSYLKTGNELNLSKIEQKSLSASSDVDGAYLISRQTSNNIAQILEEISPMRHLASREQISSSSLDIIEDYDKAQAGWTSETQSISDTDTPKINKRNIPVFELYAQPAATQKLIDDSSIDVEKWLAEKLINSFAKLESHAFIKGDGSTSPRGILTYMDGKDWGKIQ